MSKIDQFLSTFNQNSGPSHLNRFEARVFAPVVTGVSGQDQFMSLRVLSASFPGKNIRTVTNETVYGPTYEMAQGLTYAETISLTFQLSANHTEKKYISKWMDYIYKPDTYNLEYYDNYKSNIELYQLDRGDNLTAGIRLVDCYPKSYGAIDFTQESTELGTFTVEFAFKEHYMIGESGKEVEPKAKEQTSTKTGGEGKKIEVSSTGSLEDGTIIDAYGGNYRTAND